MFRGLPFLMFAGWLPLLWVAVASCQGADTLATDVAAVAAPEPGGQPAAAAPARNGRYALRKGDRIEILVENESALSGEFVVSDAGMVRYPMVGPLRVEGLSVEAAADLVRDALKNGYLVDPRVSVSVASTASPKVIVIGDVGKPGLLVRGGATLLSVLQEAQTEMHKAESRITLFREHDGVDGGSTNDSLPHLDISVGDLLKPNSEYARFEVQDGDRVFVKAGSPERVTVTGKVKTPGVIPFVAGMTVMEAVIKAGGPAEFANLAKTCVARKTEGGNQTLQVDLSDVERGDRSKDIELQPGDIVVVPKGWKLW